MTLQEIGLPDGGRIDAVAMLLGFAGALLATLCLTPLVRWFARRAGVVDRPDGQRKLQKSAVPLLGGVAVLSGFALAIAALAASASLAGFEPCAPLVLASLALLCLVGLVDDCWNLPARWKLIGQVGCTLPIIAAGLWLQKVGFCGLTVEVGYWGVPLTIAWLVAGINAVNLLDGMDGLASTIGLSIAVGIASIGAATGATSTVMLAAALAGALAGFWRYNRPPASIYLGDAGSMVIGLVLALLAMQVAVDAAGRTSLTIMAVLMAVPMADTALAVVRRLLDGRGIFSADRGHMHHRLLDRGFTSAHVLRLVVVLCALTGAIATVSRIAGWDTLAWAASGALAVVLVRARLVGYYEWSLGRRALSERLHVESPELPQPDELVAMTFDGAWNALVEIAGPASLRRLQLTLEDRFSRRHHEWTPEERQDTAENMLTIEMALRSSSGGRCHLRMESAEQLSGRLAQWRLLVEAARRFGRHWAEHPHTVPAGHLRIFADDGPSLADRPRVGASRFEMVLPVASRAA